MSISQVMISRSSRVSAALVGVILFSGATPAGSPPDPENLSALASLSDFAAFVTAISLAYAGLTNFRYRVRVLEHVRRLAEKNSLVQVMAANRDVGGQLYADESWAILYRLGRFRDFPGAPAPDLPVSVQGQNIEQDDGETDHNFKKRVDYRLYNSLYANNLDKIFSISIGAAAASVIWFSAIESMLFPVPGNAGPAREIYFGNVGAFYFYLAIVALIGGLIHLFVPHSETWPPPPDKTNWLRLTKWFGAILFFAGVGLATISSMFSGHHAYMMLRPNTVATVLNVVAATLLMEAIALPLLLMTGGYLTQAMMTECDRCYARLAKRLGKTPGQVSLKPTQPAST